LEKIGGFEALADYLADDYHLGNRVVRLAEKRIAICPIVVDCLSGPMKWSEVWSHQLRWSRTIRVCKPMPYAASILNNAVLWPSVWLALQPSKLSLLALCVCLVFRILSSQILQSRFGHIPGQKRFFWFVLFKDFLQFALWVAAFFGNHIEWRGERYRLESDGRLVAVEPALLEN
jgi:ceramide glucosyltransferase